MQFDFLSKEIFSILAVNMSVIAPTGNSYEEDYILWYNAVIESLSKDERNIILIHSDNKLIGFFQYNIKSNTLMMEEIQIKTAWQGREVFRKLFDFLFSILPSNIDFVEAYANKNNKKSQEILKHLGLKVIGKNKNGKSYHFKGNYSDLQNWFQPNKKNIKYL